MKLFSFKLAAPLLSAALLAISGCGGGSSPTVPETPAVTISGVAATGAAFVDAEVSVIDSTGAVVGTSAKVKEDGLFSITLTANAKAPFVLVASRTDANGETQTLVSVVDSVTQTRANVTPITTLIASRLSPSGDPTRLDEELVAGTATITPEAVAETVAEVKAILAPLLAATGTEAADPLTGSFATDGTGYDRLLDSISITIIPASETSSNIEIAVKSSTDGDAPPPIVFGSTDSLGDITTTNAITGSSIGGSSVSSSTLVEEGTSVKVAAFLDALTACYAVPLEQRVAGASATDTRVNGTASAVIAPACRNVFDGNDPATYLSNGRVVASNGAFSGLFRRGATGVVYSQGTYEFARNNGDWVIGYKSRDTGGAETYDSLVVRKGDDGVLRLIGNGYQFPGGVSAYHQLRRFITLDQQAYSYHSTGYSLNVDNLQKSDGSGPMFARVVVTTPTGATATVRPSAGSSFLVFYKSGVATGTNFLRLRSEFVNPGITSHPSAMDTTSLFFVSADRTEEQLAAASSQSLWTFQYFLSGNASSEPDAVQTYKTRARALTIGELRTKGFAELVPSLVNDIAMGADSSFGTLALDMDEPAYIETDGGGAAWAVPASALPPTSLTLFGRYTPPASSSYSFNDTATVRSTERKGVITCSDNPPADSHCSTTVSGGFASGAIANGLHLFSRDAAGREYAHFYAMYKVPVPPSVP
jgi:hypothetical protein